MFVGIMKRRDYLKYSGLTGAGVLAGCTQLQESPSNTELPNYAEWASSNFGENGLFVSYVDVDWLDTVDSFDSNENQFIVENEQERLGLMFPLSGFYTSTFAIGYSIVNYPFGEDISAAVSDPASSPDWVGIDSYTFINSGFIFTGEFNPQAFEELYPETFSRIDNSGPYTIFELETNSNNQTTQNDRLRIALSENELLIPIDRTNNSIRLSDLIGLASGENRFTENSEDGKWVFENAGEGPLALGIWDADVTQTGKSTQYAESIEGIVGVADIQENSASSSTAFSFNTELTEEIRQNTVDEFATGAEQVDKNRMENLYDIQAQWDGK